MTRHCPHHTALPVQDHIYTPTGSYSLFISIICSAISLANFFPLPVVFPGHSTSSNKKIILNLVLLPTPPVSLHLPSASFTDLTSDLSVTVWAQTSAQLLDALLRHFIMYVPRLCPVSGKLTSSCSFYWMAHAKVHLLSWSRWNCKFLTTFSCNQN